MNLIDEVYYHPAVKELINCIIELTLIDNVSDTLFDGRVYQPPFSQDMASYNREQATGDENHNLITVTMRELGLDRSGAMSWAAAYHSEIRAKFINGLSELPSWGSTLDSQLKEYLDGIANWAQGNYCWSYESQRYFGSKGPEIKKTRLVPLLPRSCPQKSHGKDIVIVDLQL